jgi:hypothetical protein
MLEGGSRPFRLYSFRPSHSVNDYLVARWMCCASFHNVSSIAQLATARYIRLSLNLRADGMRVQFTVGCAVYRTGVN